MTKLVFIFFALATFTYYGFKYQEGTEQSELTSNKGPKTESSFKDEKPKIESQQLADLAHSNILKPFMENYCFSCHNEKKKKGKLRLDNLAFNSESMLVWQDVVDQLTTGDMPPEDEKIPTMEERQKVISAVQVELDRHGSKPSNSVLRRLTKNEYVNTIRDLFGMKTEVFMGASEFPPDERKHNFSNNGEALVTSSYLMDKYLNSANALVEQILPQEEKAKPKAQKLTFTPPFLSKTRDHSSWFYGKDKFQDILQNDTSLRDIYLHIKKFENGAPERGLYKIKLTLEGKNRTKNPSPLGNKLEALSVKLTAGKQTDGSLGRAAKSDKFIGEFPLPDDKVYTLETSTWLEKGYSLKITFPQGLYTVKQASNRARRNKPDYLKGVNPKRYIDKSKFSWTKKVLGKKPKASHPIDSQWATFMEEYSKHYPTLRLYKVEIEGPFYDEWPHRPKKFILGDKSYENCNPQDVISKLAVKAFRRPVERGEIQPILDFVNDTYRKTHNKREALANGIRAILCSPQFFYHYENKDKLDEYALASRLSYLVWSSMPDERLMSLASAGKLSNKETLQAELERMLRDPRSKQMTFNLADQWLELWKLGNMAPSIEDEEQYYRRHLKELSKYETTEFLDYILKNNKPVMDILTADYTFMNRGLAEFYGVKDFYKYPTHKFIKTEVKDSRRLGIFGHMGLLTATANGVDTSPIIRGLWVYETVLGKTAPPPPDSVPAIEPDLRNAKTIRDKLVKHREDKECSVCHRKFDHFGFALENFDQLGRWRTDYTDHEKKKIKVPISSYGTMVSGEKFKNISDMRQLLAKEEKMFSNTVASKLLTMALGRETNAFDRDDIKKILQKAKSNGNGLKDILTSVVTSELFRSK